MRSVLARSRHAIGLFDAAERLVAQTMEEASLRICMTAAQRDVRLDKTVQNSLSRGTKLSVPTSSTACITQPRSLILLLGSGLRLLGSLLAKVPAPSLALA